ncbi:DUF7527 domain-containing protein [Natronorubrum halophilum]|uniref:DUF7527 domain-containing protein n=1 Tax=Natronorubrum halophilum TaxID=1702106 RepID=UPI000EF6D346|nr:transcriptional regulator [Natronorubrum halophilum]
MDSRTQERVEQWDSRSFSGGYDGLADLAAADFSGAVVATGTWLFMLNGRVVGVVDGGIEDFESASGTVYEAPHPSLPLLCAMEERGGETRAKYYTNETALREVDETLQDGSFTGYIELSENVLSGDYYAVYYGGRRMAAAYIGNSERLLTDDEAFDRADDEVGIYEVRTVDIDVADVPGADESEAGDGDEGRIETGVDAEPTANAVAKSEPDERPVARSEPKTDPTESAIGSIDLSGTDPDTTTADETTTGTAIEDIAIDDAISGSSTLEGTGEPSGITATDDAEPEPTSSGITDAGVETDSELDSTSVEDEQADTERTTHEYTAAELESDDDRTGGDGSDSERTRHEPASPSAETAEANAGPGSSGGESTDATTADADTVDSDEIRTAGADTERTEGSGPDPAAVAEAAEQLDQNDISWTEDDIESQSEDDAAEESASNGPAGSRPDPTPRPEKSEIPEERFEEEEQWREARTIPSIDPDHSETAESGGRDSNENHGGTTQRTQNRRSSGSDAAEQSDGGSRNASTSVTESATGSTQTGRQRQRSTEGTQTRQPTGRTDRADAGAGTDSSDESATASAAGSSAEHDQRVATLTRRLETLAEQRDALVAKAEELEAERDQLRSENEELSSTVERLRSRVETLQTDLERAREATGGASESDASTQLSPQRALAETNLFVRYTSKSQPTLETAHDGQADRDEVASNLRLEHHTGFDAADVAVDGERYEAFLTGTMEHRFVDWLTATVLYEIRDTGNADALGDLYDAIPRIDRAELGATISLADDDTEDVPDEVTFDVVAFDKMGNPLVVANLNDSREPATEPMLEEMEEAASAVKANYPSLAAATVVTSSYFDPGALEVAERATSSGLLSRGSKLSYVNLSRKQGYHLCLVESRSEGFHMNVPEL